jgi:hypothetical protein
MGHVRGRNRVFSDRCIRRTPSTRSMSGAGTEPRVAPIRSRETKRTCSNASGHERFCWAFRRRALLSGISPAPNVTDGKKGALRQLSPLLPIPLLESLEFADKSRWRDPARLCGLVETQHLPRNGSTHAPQWPQHLFPNRDRRRETRLTESNTRSQLGSHQVTAAHKTLCCCTCGWLGDEVVVRYVRVVVGLMRP